MKSSIILALGVFNLIQSAIATVNSTPQALNPQLTNIIPNGNGPVLYYNGSGPVPPYNMLSPVPQPLPPLSQSQIEDLIFAEILAVAYSSNYPTNCTKCIAVTEIMHIAAITQPVDTIVNLLIRSCEQFQYSIYAATCAEEYSGIGNTGPYLAQLFAKMSEATGDMEAWCAYSWRYCTPPPVIQINETQWFTPKPSGGVAPPSSGQTINVLHLTDWHLDPRYDIGSEANCSQYLCCRPYSTNTRLNTVYSNASVPASRYGYLYCDTPADLGLSLFTDMPQFINVSNIAFSIFTGDIVSHDNDDQLSMAYIEYSEQVTFQTFKANLGNTPVYATLGNHDSLPEAMNTPNNIRSDGGPNAFSWNYQLVSSLWQNSGWIDSTAASYASTHYGAYSYVTPQGLKIVSLNTDFWYVDNIFNFYNFTNPDNSGILSFLISELEASEKINQRVWIIGHVLSGYDGNQPLPNPTALFYSIVRRFSPVTIAGIFFGHTHEDQLMIYYDYAASSFNSTTGLRNTTNVDYTSPLNVGFIGPSITPLSGNNAGWRVYQVDAKTFSVVGIQNYYANVSESNTWTSPEWRFEYDARTIYDPGSKWGKNDPLNATFWHGVTNNMLSNLTLLETYNFFETKMSVVTRNCSTQACAQQKVCYIRSGSAALGTACGSSNGPF